MSRTTHPARRRLAAAVSILALAGVGLAACSDDESADTSSNDTTETTTTASDDMGSSDDMGNDDMSGDTADEMATEPSGPACAAVPAEGSGSFTGMAQDPAATAASNNPELSTLVTAVQTAGLVDTLNGDGPFTIFAPANAAFEAIPADTLQAVLADQEQLTSILTYHVIAGEQLSADELVEQGSAVTVQGDELQFSDEGGSLMVNGMATGVCVDVPTANATVHIIDAVLMPPA
jgi:uncharacterized surface protein with fasciclin (FAS1) repeats